MREGRANLRRGRLKVLARRSQERHAPDRESSRTLTGSLAGAELRARRVIPGVRPPFGSGMTTQGAPPKWRAYLPCAVRALRACAVAPTGAKAARRSVCQIAASIGYVPPAFDITANDDGTISFWGGRWRQVEPLLFQLASGQLESGEVLVAFREDQNGQITHMLNGTVANERLPPTINLDPQILNGYVGQYEITPNQLVTITLEGGRLMGEMTGRPKVELSPTSETRFVIREAEAEVNFVSDEQGRVTHLLLRLNGEEMRARRIR